jgi:S-(hydroxymethyl)mycothiol dehydrogenase
MPHEVSGVISRSKKQPVELTTIVVPNPGPGEALVRVQACGVCHTDLHYREGAVNDDFPFLLGHEAAGIVEEVGADVTDVAPGDYVRLAGCAAPAPEGKPGTASEVLMHPNP